MKSLEILTSPESSWRLSGEKPFAEGIGGVKYYQVESADSSSQLGTAMVFPLEGNGDQIRDRHQRVVVMGEAFTFFHRPNSMVAEYVPQLYQQINDTDGNAIGLIIERLDGTLLNKMPTYDNLKNPFPTQTHQYVERFKHSVLAQVSRKKRLHPECINSYNLFFCSNNTLKFATCRLDKLGRMNRLADPIYTHHVGQHMRYLNEFFIQEEAQQLKNEKFNDSFLGTIVRFFASGK